MNEKYPWVDEKWEPIYQEPKAEDLPEIKIKRALLYIESFETELLTAIEHAKNPNPGGQQVSFNNEFINIPLPRLYKILHWAELIKHALEGK